MKNVLLVCIALFLMYCHPEEKKDKHIAIESDSIRLPHEYAIITDFILLKYWFTTDYIKPVKLSEKDLIQIERLIIDAYNREVKSVNSSSIYEFKTYKRQYASYLNNKGEWIVWVNAFCEIPDDFIEDSSGEFRVQKMDWKNHIVQAEDGGSCYWQIYINMKIKKGNLHFNGEA